MVNPLGTRIGTNIALARKAKGLTQAVVAERIGIDPISLSRMERGVALPGLATLDQLARVLEVPLTQLIEGISGHLPSSTDAVTREFESLSEEDRLFLIEQIRGWAQHLRTLNRP